MRNYHYRQQAQQQSDACTVSHVLFSILAYLEAWCLASSSSRSQSGSLDLSFDWFWISTWNEWNECWCHPQRIDTLMKTVQKTPDVIRYSKISHGILYWASRHRRQALLARGALLPNAAEVLVMPLLGAVRKAMMVLVVDSDKLKKGGKKGVLCVLGNVRAGSRAIEIPNSYPHPDPDPISGFLGFRALPGWTMKALERKRSACGTCESPCDLNLPVVNSGYLPGDKYKAGLKST